MLDLSRCGGPTEARKIAAMAEAWHAPIAPHDRVGPVVCAASCRLSLHARNALIQDSVRAFYTGWYDELATGPPTYSFMIFSRCRRLWIGGRSLGDTVPATISMRPIR
jgi:L-alanine-DL-glutamate epimerase-like enolase superfamily enzyme